jgi:hypothetical protein
MQQARARAIRLRLAHPEQLSDGVLLAQAVIGTEALAQECGCTSFT